MSPHLPVPRSPRLAHATPPRLALPSPLPQPRSESIQPASVSVARHDAGEGSPAATERLLLLAALVGGGVLFALTPWWLAALLTGVVVVCGQARSVHSPR